MPRKLKTALLGSLWVLAILSIGTCMPQVQAQGHSCCPDTSSDATPKPYLGSCCIRPFFHETAPPPKHTWQSTPVESDHVPLPVWLVPSNMDGLGDFNQRLISTAAQGYIKDQSNRHLELGVFLN